MTKYAQNLIGDWETEQFEPLRQVAQKTYQTNWDKLTNDFNSLNEQLAQNFKNARIQHNNALLNNARNSYMRMVNAEQNLANRGLTGSGLLNTYDAMNTQQTGKENDVALQTLMDANKANIEGRLSGLDTYSRNTSGLSDDLLSDLAGITDAEGDNIRKYRDLIASLSESAANRASKYSSDSDEELDNLYQLITINDIMANAETDDSTKFSELVTDAAVSPEQAERILSSYNYNKISADISEQQSKLDKKVENINKYDNAKAMNYFASFGPLRAITGPVRALGWFSNVVGANNAQNKINKLNTDLSKYTYEDLKDIMGY